MALPDTLAIVVGTIIVLADTTDYANGQGLGARTDQIDMTSIAADGYRQSTQFDFGANRATLYSMTASIEYATAPAAGEAMNFYLAFSPNATAGTGNPGGVSGSDADYTGYSSNAADSVKQLTYIGSMILTVQATTTVQISNIGVFTPIHRYASLVWHNGSAADATFTDAVEAACLIEPMSHQIQD